jgi:hypothetical protein
MPRTRGRSGLEQRDHDEQQVHRDRDGHHGRAVGRVDVPRRSLDQEQRADDHRDQHGVDRPPPLGPQ